MKTFGKLIRSAVRQVFDPDRELRIQQLAAELYKGLQTDGDKFSIRKFANHVDCAKTDLEHAKRMVYQTLIDRAWKDNKLSAAEQQTIKWVTACLAISKIEATSIQNAAARERFATILSRSMEDGILADEEAAHLDHIARSIGFELGHFVRTYFRSEGEDFLRNTFAACTEGGVLAKDAWARLAKATEKLGLSKKDLLATVRPQAERFVEHALVDAKSDGELSEKEESTLLQLIQTLALPTDSSEYFLTSIAGLRIIRLARQGKLPTLGPPKTISIRAGEIVHFHSPATWLQ